MFDEQVRGIVRDSSGAPIAGATVTTCDDGNRCDVGGTACRSVVTASDGAFELSVEQCSPSVNQCELRPIVITMDGCTSIDAQPAHNGTAVLSFELACT
ncbi:MAG: carboxypeptidase regulatory-like domain-containing protein [Myxococcales bacterium]|nr:carboxypeptidase regulatory-like domain-containing protein [Myxococcales bacterium]